ncbi:hypothetical protein KZ770_02200 [Escherichia coli]|nr:hypothetical protein [Escherichia coli]
MQQAPRESISQLIDHANSHPAPIAAVDIPSGLLAETGATPGRSDQRRSHHHFYCAETEACSLEKARDVTGQLHF